jgi:glycosyltransferase 2 family protein
MKSNIKTILQFVLFLSIGGCILFYFYNTQDRAFQEQLRLEGKSPYPLIQKLIADFKTVNLFWVGMSLLAFTISNLSRAIRWNMLMRPLGHQPKLYNAFFAVNISYLTNLVVSRAGEAVRASSIAKVEKMSASKVMGTVVIDRLLDMITLLFIVCFAFLIEYDLLWGWLDKNLGSGNGKFRLLQHPLFGGMAIFSVISMILLWKFKDRIVQISWVQKIWHIVEKFGEGLKTVRKVERPGWFIFHSLLIWFMYYMMTYLCFYSFAPTAHLPAIAALTVFVFGTFGIVIPSPGGMGTYHVLATAALMLHGVNGNDGFSFANIVFFSIQIFYNIIVGVISIILMNFLNKKVQTEPSLSTSLN